MNLVKRDSQGTWKRARVCTHVNMRGGWEDKRIMRDGKKEEERIVWDEEKKRSTYIFFSCHTWKLRGNSESSVKIGWAVAKAQGSAETVIQKPGKPNIMIYETQERTTNRSPSHRY